MRNKIYVPQGQYTKHMLTTEKCAYQKHTI